MPFSSDDLTPVWFLAQACSLVSIGIFCWNNIRPIAEKKALLPVTALSVIFYGLSFAILGAWVGALMSFLGAARFLLAAYAGKPRLFFWVFLVLQLAAGWVFWKSPADLIVLSGAALSTYVVFFLDGMAYRKAILGVPVLYTLYSLTTGNYLNIMLDALSFTTYLIGIWRIRHP